MAIPTAKSIPGKGWDLQVASPTTSFTSIPGITTIDGPDSSVGERDTTTLLSAAKERAPTIPDFGHLTANLMYDNTNAVHQVLTGLVATQPSSGLLWKLVAPTTTISATFNAIVNGFPISGISVEGTVMAALRLGINGPLTYPASV